jgi:hypothetical protein
VLLLGVMSIDAMAANMSGFSSIAEAGECFKFTAASFDAEPLAVAADVGVPSPLRGVSGDLPLCGDFSLVRGVDGVADFALMGVMGLGGSSSLPSATRSNVCSRPDRAGLIGCTSGFFAGVNQLSRLNATCRNRAPPQFGWTRAESAEVGIHTGWLAIQVCEGFIHARD